MPLEALYSYFMSFPQFAITWGMFFGAGLLTFAFQLYRNRGQFAIKEMLDHCIPFSPWNSKSFHMDVLLYVYRKFTDFVFLTPGVAVMALAAAFTDLVLRRLLGDMTPYHVGYVATFICTIGIFLAAELADYVVHYLEHKVPVLWELHKVHHSADFLNPLTAKRGHSLPLLYGGAMAGMITGPTAGVFMYVFGISLPEALLLKAVAGKIFTVWTLDPLKHSHIPVGLGWFDCFLISPHMHQIHHSKLQPHWDRNFGTNLSIFDWLFRTGYRPAKGEKIVFGISGYSDNSLQKFNTIKGAFITPMLRSGRALLKLIRPKLDSSAAVSSEATEASTVGTARLHSER
jgi:sterol desaturase/sphingolipid hydroxylase (fatty acid hydroxylase superfamily)